MERGWKPDRAEHRSHDCQGRAGGNTGIGTYVLQQLRPVTFHLETEPHGALQYGLIAEEVNRVYPDLVIRNEAGAIQGVRYDELAPLLLGVAPAQTASRPARAQIRRLDPLIAMQ